MSSYSHKILMSVLLGAAVVACGGSAEERNDDVNEDVASTESALTKCPVHALAGTWTSSESDPDVLLWYTFTFNLDGTYSSIGGCRNGESGGFPCNAIAKAHGTFKVRNGKLVTTDSLKQTSTYAYSISGNVLSMHDESNPTDSIFKKE